MKDLSRLFKTKKRIKCSDCKKVIEETDNFCCYCGAEQ